MTPTIFDTIVIGGSFAGLSAAQSLGRSVRKVLIIDAGEPCNAKAAHSYNFLTQDGQTPTAISELARRQLQNYPTIQFEHDYVQSARKTDTYFEVITASGQTHTSRKLILATGVKDVFPDIPGFAEAWGKSIVHCPYCHGYEIRNRRTAIVTNGEEAEHYASIIYNINKQITILTNGPSTISPEFHQKLADKNINVITKVITSFEQHDGIVSKVNFDNHEPLAVKVVYHKPKLVQPSSIATDLGCTLNEHGFIAVDNMFRATVPGLFACGDNAGAFRSIAQAVYTGSTAGAVVNMELSHEDFQ